MIAIRHRVCGGLLGYSFETRRVGGRDVMLGAGDLPEHLNIRLVCPKCGDTQLSRPTYGQFDFERKR